MKRLSWIALLLIAFGALAPVQSFAQSEDWKTRISQLVQNRKAAELFQDGVVGAVSGSKEELLTFGNADVNSLFEIGSVTKSFTGIIFAQLVIEGRLAPTSSVKQFIPELAKTPVGELTLEQLATHRSGLPIATPDLPAGANPYAEYNWTQLISALKTMTPDPAGTPSYSNVGFALLGQILASVDHLDFAALVEKRITQPLKMKSTHLVVPKSECGRLLNGYGVDLSIVPHWDWNVYAPTGGLRSSANDMMAYLRANLNPDSSLLGKAILLSQKNRWGWDDELLGVSFHYKNGGTGGFRSALLIDPVRQVGSIVLSNVAFDNDILAFSILGPIPETIDAAVPVKTLESYEGVYTFTDDPRLKLSLQIPDHYLIADFKDLAPAQGRARLIAKSPTEFAVIDNAGGLSSANAEIHFQTDSDGKITGLSLLLDGQAPMIFNYQGNASPK